MRLIVVVFSVLGAIKAHFPGDHIPKEARWCCTNNKELLKCQSLSRVVFAAQRNFSISMNLTCVTAINVTQCMSRIARNQADLVTLSEEDIYKAGKHYGLVPVVGEQTNREKHTSYYSVALILTSASSSLSLSSLQGVTTCHPVAGDTAGWQVPMGYLLATNQMLYRKCSTFLSAGEMFKKSCVPGALSSKYNPSKQNPRNLCDLCQKEDCPAGTAEKYYAYEGTYRCLVEKRAHVAFVRHTTVFEYTGELNNLNPGKDFKLLCPGGKRGDVGDYKTCSLARIPGSVVMTRDPGKEQFRSRGYRLFLLELDSYLKNNQELFQLFNSTQFGGKDLLFHDSTLNLVDVEEKNTTDKWLGASYKRALDALYTCKQDIVKAARSNTEPIAKLWSCHVIIIAIATIVFLWWQD